MTAARRPRPDVIPRLAAAIALGLPPGTEPQRHEVAEVRLPNGEVGLALNVIFGGEPCQIILVQKQRQYAPRPDSAAHFARWRAEREAKGA